MNNVVLKGNLVRDPETRVTPSGMSCVEFTLAVSDRYKSKTNEWVDDVSFVGCYIWGPMGDVFSKNHRKGTSALVVGKLKQENWTNKDGKQMSKTRVKVEGFDQIDFRVIEQNRGAATESAPVRQATQQKAAPAMDDENDNVPF